jgi:hypothetical protein
MTTTSKGSKKVGARVPAALAKRAEAAAKGKLARLVAEAKADIALIGRRRAEISEAFYDIGEALVRLKRREVVAAMGCRSFAELCERQVGLSSSQAERLVDIVTSMTRTEALSVGATKAASIVALARATPEDDTASELLAHGARVRGKVIDVTKASTRALAKAAAEARGGKAPKGRGVTREERASCAALAAALRAAGAKDAKVTAKAGRVAGAGRAVIELAIADLHRLAQASTVRAPRR